MRQDQAAGMPAPSRRQDSTELSVIFGRDGNATFVPTPLAAGPFGGLQGGAVAGVIATAIEDAAPAGMQPLSVRVDFLRPVQMAPLHVSTEVVRRGRRVATMAATATVGTTVVARAVMALAYPAPSPVATEDQRTFSVPDHDAPRLPRIPRPDPILMDAFDARSVDGVFWFRWLTPLCDGATPFAQMLGPADWAHGLTRPALPELARVGFPNVDLSVAVHRQPTGMWTGLRAASTWTAHGVGTVGGELLDEQGAFGRLVTAFVITA